MSIRRSVGAARHAAGRFERLEDRAFLSADSGIGGPPHSVQQFEISIIGTQVSYSPAGLPTDMKGLVYLDTAAGVSSAPIGTYDETLQPIFAPVGPGGTPAFVGATGICTFDFDLEIGNRSFALGSIVASDTSLIEGALPDGTLLVGSTSSPITSATGICQGLSGSFDAQSQVRMGASFYMQTTVEFAVHDRPGVEMEETLTALAVANSALAQGHSEHGGAPAALAELDSSAHHYAAVDSVFASESGLGGNDIAS